MGNIDRMKKGKNIIPGIASEYAKAAVKAKNTKRSDDYENRQYVRNKILEYIKEGLVVNEIVKRILSDDVMKNFGYLEKNGLDITKCVTSWVQDAMNKNIEIDQQCK